MAPMRFLEYSLKDPDLKDVKLMSVLRDRKLK